MKLTQINERQRRKQLKDEKENQIKKTIHGHKRCLVSQGLHWITIPKGHSNFGYLETYNKSGYVYQSEGM